MDSHSLQKSTDFYNLGSYGGLTKGLTWNVKFLIFLKFKGIIQD